MRGKTGVGCNLMTRIDYFSAENSILILQIIGKVWPLESAAQVYFFLLFSCGVLVSEGSKQCQSLCRIRANNVND